MQSTEIIQRVRELADVGTELEFPAITDAMILDIATSKLRSVLGKHITDSDSGQWLQSELVTCVESRTKYRLPRRCLNGGVYQIEIWTSSEWRPIDMVTAKHSRQYTSPLAAVSIQGDSLMTLLPGNGTLKVWYYLCPSRIVPAQADGRITAIDLGTRKLSWNNNPKVAQNGTLGAVLNTTDNPTIDIVSPTGWHQCQITDMPLTITSGGIIAPAGYAIEDIQVGDCIRASGQTDWPALPEEDHSMLAGMVAIVVAQINNDQEKAQQIAQTIATEYQEFPNKLTPRVRTQSRRIPLTRRF